MAFTRRDMLRLLMASAVANVVDVEELLWTPKPIVVVPAMPGIASIHMAHIDMVLTKISLEYIRSDTYMFDQIFPMGPIPGLAQALRYTK